MQLTIEYKGVGDGWVLPNKVDAGACTVAKSLLYILIST